VNTASTKGLPDGGLSRKYDNDFEVGHNYIATLPDIRNGPSSAIVGAPVSLPHVGIANFHVPVVVELKEGGLLTVEASVTGTVDLAADSKGINMSRIMRTFYDKNGGQLALNDLAREVADTYRSTLGAENTRVQVSFRLPMPKKSLRSDNQGWQYYDITFEVVSLKGDITEIVHIDYLYSSTCPCSLELSEHSRRERNQLATPHSQRSVARVSAVLNHFVWFEDLVEMCRRAVPTETQVVVKREDEQAFAELNAANPIFVEDAVRAFAGELMQFPEIGDFRVIASHQESLHSHDAIAVVHRGDTFEAASIDPLQFMSLRK